MRVIAQQQAATDARAAGTRRDGEPSPAKPDRQAQPQPRPQPTGAQPLPNAGTADNRNGPRRQKPAQESRGAQPRPDMPAQAQGTGQSQARARSLLGEIAEMTVEDVFEEGLHEFLTRFIRQAGELAQIVSDTYLSGQAR